MATLTIRDLPEEVRSELRVRAARHGRSMEAEVRAILQDAVASPGAEGLGTRVHRRFADVGLVALDTPARSERPRAASLPK